MKKIITIKPDGAMHFLYDDQLRGLLIHGPATITRASRVEPGNPAKGQDPLKWYADMVASDNVVLGPYDTRAEALQAEADWLNTHVLTWRQPESTGRATLALDQPPEPYPDVEATVNVTAAAASQGIAAQGAT